MLHRPTPSEQRLWEGLRAAGLPAAFKRQVVLCDRFIVDVLAPAAHVVIEVDGPLHERRRTADARRDRVLARAGYRVLRFTVEEVVHRLAEVLERVRAQIELLRR